MRKFKLIPSYITTVDELGLTVIEADFGNYTGLTWEYEGDTTGLDETNYATWPIIVCCSDETADLIREDADFTIQHEEII